MTFFTRWKYRFISWFYDQPNALKRRVAVENILMQHWTKQTQPTAQQCLELALKLGVPK